jgi:5,10-methylenetetrahydromethanopterin reductase
MSETKMDLELQLLGDVPVTRLIDRARLAEANNYSAVWVSDERFYRDVYMCLAQIASHTSHVRVGTSVTDPYIRHPALTAVAMATLDEISGGRAVLGIGAGISGFAELQVERRKPARVMREAIAVIRSLLNGDTADFQGDVITLNHGRLSFCAGRVVPVYVASNGVMGQRMAAEVADGIIVNACASVAEVRALRAAVEETARRIGRDPRTVKIAARLNT